MNPRLTLLTDGTSDKILLHPIHWLLDLHGFQLDTQWTYGYQGRTSSRLKQALDQYPCDLVVVHRDGEREEPDQRRREIREGLDGKTSPPLVCLVPVRMTEAWFLFDEANLRRAAGNPNGEVALNLPRMQAVEGLPNPKEILYEALTNASELKGRRAKNFRPQECLLRMAELIQDYSPLNELGAFQDFSAEFLAALKRLP